MANILFIDDDPAFAGEMKFLLEESGLNVVTVHDGLEAFEILKKREFDLVVTDMIMVSSHGTEVILHLKEFYPRIRIITISGGGWASPAIHLDAAKVMGSDSCLVKPFAFRELLAEISRLLNLEIPFPSA